MAEILVKAVDATNPDPEKQRRGCYRKGDPVLAMPDGHAWGAEEGPPKFVVIKVPGIDPDQINDRIGQWRQALNHEVVGQSIPLDGWRIRLFATLPGAAQEAGVTRSQVEGTLNRWNATVHSTRSNEVVLDFTVYGGATSEGFWERDVSSVTFEELAYDQSTGVHRIRVQYGDGMVRSRQLEAAATQKATVVSASPGVVVFEVERRAVRQKFQSWIMRATERTHIRRRWTVPGADVDFALAQGGEVTTTLATFRSRLVDRAT